jgi:hypothetical protein
MAVKRVNQELTTARPAHAQMGCPYDFHSARSFLPLLELHGWHAGTKFSI